MANDVLMVRNLSERSRSRTAHNLDAGDPLGFARPARREGVTVFRGVAGFGADGEVHADDMLRLSVDLPLVIEFFDEPTVAEAAIHLLETWFLEDTSYPGRPNVMAMLPCLRSEAELRA